MNILIIGQGGREHALAWKIAQSSRVKQVFVAPGNAGTAQENKCRNINIAADDLPGLLKFARQENMDLTVVGPEVPLVAGVVDQFQAAGLAIFGPSQKAAQLEGSKSFSKDFMQRHGIPTAAYGVFTDRQAALTYLQSVNFPVVLKADGLAAGKGVVIAQTRQEAEATTTDMLSGNAFGQAGCQIVIEEFLTGEEASFIVMADGVHALALATSQDHKARDDNDQGPNTGGMGAYSPAPLVSADLHQDIMRTVIQPTLEGMAAEGMPYSGFLYAGIMVTADGPKVLEFNCRLGDPEAQPLLMRLQSDLLELCQATLSQTLDQQNPQWYAGTALGVVLAAGGYPQSYKKGLTIHGLNNTFDDDCKVFHAGTRQDGSHIYTDGGRVLCVCARGDSLTVAQQKAYAMSDKIYWENYFFRRDIGNKALSRSA